MINRIADQKLKNGDRLTDKELEDLLAGYQQLLVAMEGVGREYSLMQNEVHRRVGELLNYHAARQERYFKEQLS